MTALTQAQLAARLTPPAWFFFLQTATPVRVWSGVGDYPMPPSAVDADGGLYKGLGIVVSVPEMTIPLNGAMKRHDFSLTGVSDNVMRLVNVDRHTVRGSKVSFGLTKLSATGQPVGDVGWYWRGIADTPRVTRDGTTQPPKRTITISIGAGETGRKRRQLVRWTGQDQRQRSADDAFCDRTVLYDQQSTEIWPK